MKNVLIIAYNHRPFHDPKSSSAPERSYAYEQFLPIFGWRPIVVCSDYATRRQGLPVPAKSEVEHALTSSDKAIVWATSSREFGGLFELVYRRLIDAQGPKLWQKLINMGRKVCVLGCMLTSGDIESCNWEKHAKDMIRNIAESIDIHACVVSYSPHTSMRLGNWLCKEYKIPWLVEFRDPWSLWFGSQISQWIFAPEMRRLAKSASAIAAVSEPLAQSDRVFFHRDVYVIRNGYNPLDYELVTPRTRDHLTIVYTGSVPEQRKIGIFFKALRMLLDSGLITDDSLGFYYFGPNSEYIMREAEYAGVVTLTHIDGIVARDVALGWQLGADVLLHLTWPKGQKGFYSGKIFEYLYARRNILAIPGDGDVVDSLLRETGAGISIETPEEVASKLAEWQREKTQYGVLTYMGREKEITKYDRRISTGKLSEILDNIAR